MATPMSDAEAINASIAAVGGWRGDTLARLRALIHEAVPGVVEEVKWRKPSNPAGVPAYSHGGLMATLEHYKDKVKVTFARGGEIEDPAGVFTGGFGGKRRVVDLHEGDALDEEAFKGLVRAAARVNGGSP